MDSTSYRRAHPAFGCVDTREARAYPSCPQVNTVTAKGHLWRAILLHSLHMAVIGVVRSVALYAASDPFRSTP